MRLFIPTLLALALAAPCARDAPAARFSRTTFTADDGTKVDAELGELAVPENRASAASKTITLRFVRFRSTSQTPGAPIVYLAGGPGSSGLAAARGPRFPLFMALRAFGDVIALDQRGVGKSEPRLDCAETYLVDPSAPLTRESAGRAFREPASQCLAGLRAKGIDPAAYNTAESAHDLDDLRAALGAPKATLWAISYGTHLALAALKAHGAGIERVILAGVEPLDATEKLPSDQQRLLEELARRAAEAKVHADLLGALASLARTLDEKPRAVPLVHPLTKQKAELVLGKGDLQVVVAQMLTGPETFNALPDLVTRLEAGDWTALALASARWRTGKLPSAMSIAMDCASGASEARRKRIAEEKGRTLLGDAVNMPFPEVCAGLGIPELGDAFRAPVRSDVPALLISGTLDGRTPPGNAEEIVKTLPNAVSLVIEGAGHSDPLFLSSPKILETMQRFLRGEKLAASRAEAPPFRFIPPRRVVALPDEALERLAGDYRIGEKGVRKIVKAGSVLWSIRDDGAPNPLRPSGPDELFFEGAPVSLMFEPDESGRVVALTFVSPDAPPVKSPRIR